MYDYSRKKSHKSLMGGLGVCTCDNWTLRCCHYMVHSAIEKNSISFTFLSVFNDIFLMLNIHYLRTVYTRSENIRSPCPSCIARTGASY